VGGIGSGRKKRQINEIEMEVSLSNRLLVRIACQICDCPGHIESLEICIWRFLGLMTYDKAVVDLTVRERRYLRDILEELGIADREGIKRTRDRLSDTCNLGDRFAQVKVHQITNLIMGAAEEC